MHQEAGPSSSSSPRQVGDSDDSEDAKQRTIKITMGGGLRSAESMLSTLIPEPALRNLATAFPDGRDGETNVFFVSFPSIKMAQVVSESPPKGLSITPITDSEFDILTTIYQSTVHAAQKDHVVPRFSGCPSPETTVPTSGATASRSPHPKIHQASDNADDTETSPHEEVGDDSQGQLPGPPKRRRRLSNGESGVTSPSVPLTENLLNLLDKFTSALLREFPSAPVPPETHHPDESDAAPAVGNDHELGNGGNVGSSTSHSSTTAKGKRPMK